MTLSRFRGKVIFVSLQCKRINEILKTYSLRGTT